MQLAVKFSCCHDGGQYLNAAGNLLAPLPGLCLTWWPLPDWRLSIFSGLHSAISPRSAQDEMPDALFAVSTSLPETRLQASMAETLNFKLGS